MRTTDPFAVEPEEEAICVMPSSTPHMTDLREKDGGPVSVCCCLTGDRTGRVAPVLAARKDVAAVE